MTTILKLVSVLFLITLVFTSFAFAATITVAQDGSANYTTIKNALNKAQAGDAVVVLDSGVYNENDLKIRKSVTLDCQGAVINGNKNSNGIELMDKADNAEVKNCVIQNHAFGIIQRSRSDNVKITGNTIENYSIAIILSGANTLIEGNTIGEPSLTASSTRAGIVACGSNYTISGNTIASDKMVFAIQLTAAPNSIIQHNVINGQYGIRLAGTKNNIITENTFDNPNGILYMISDVKTSRPEWKCKANICKTKKIGSVYDNEFYHNKIIGSAAIVIEGFVGEDAITLDNGYPSAGNYWSTFTAPDLLMGPNQDVTGSDGIVDHPFSTSMFTDRYPLTSAYTGPINAPPVANYTHTNSTNTNFEFTDESYDFDGTISSWHWIFGDGTASTNVNPTHVYTANGDYSVTLMVTDNGGKTASMSKTVTVAGIIPANEAPVANFTWSCSELNCTFFDLSTDSDGTIVSWAWDIGNDGYVVTIQNASRTFAAPGNYTVSLTVIDDDGATGFYNQTIEATESPVLNAAPTANFTFACTDLTCVFTDASTDSDGTITSYAWDFNDTASSSDANPTHTFAANGNYTVKLTVTDDDGATDEYEQNIEVIQTVIPNVAPTANFTWSCNGLTCEFTDESEDTDGSIVSWTWETNSATYNTQNATHTFPGNGTYNVTLTVTDNNGAANTTVQEVTAEEGVITNVAPVAIAGSNQSAFVSNTVTLNGSASYDTDGTIALYEWDFNGDGVYDWNSTATGVTTHVYTAEGTYNATLRVTDNNGATDTSTIYIKVSKKTTGGGGGGGTAWMPNLPNITQTADEEPEENETSEETQEDQYDGTIQSDNETTPSDEEQNQRASGLTGFFAGSFADPVIAGAMAFAVAIAAIIFLNKAAVAAKISSAFGKK